MLGVGGYWDPEKFYCPCCADLTAIHQGRSHERCFNGAALMPGESLSAFADCHNKFLWDLLRLNLGRLRTESLLPRFSGNELASKELCANALAHLDQEIDLTAWTSDSLHPETPSVPTDELKDRIIFDLGPVVLDQRDPAFCGAYYKSKKQNPQLNTTGFRRPARPASDLPEPALMALYVVGHGALLRLDSILDKCDLP